MATIDIDDIVTTIEAAALAESIIGGQPLSGKLMHSGSLTRFRSRAAE